MWWQRNFTLEGKINIFKTLTLSKFVFLAQVLPISNETITIIQQKQSVFLWNSNNVKIKHVSICNDFQNRGLKRMWTYVAKFVAYNALGFKKYTTKTPITESWFQYILLIMYLGKLYFSFKS